MKSTGFTHPKNEFYPCNKREADILTRLSGDALEEYKRLRHTGATVTEALEQVEMQTLDAGEECPFCKNGTVDVVGKEVRCKGECGNVVTRRKTQVEVPEESESDFSAFREKGTSGPTPI